MDKNTVTGFLLIALVVVGFSWYSRPSEAELENMARRDSAAAVSTHETRHDAPAAATASPAATADSAAPFAALRQGRDSEVRLENSKVSLTLGTRGGMVRSARIKGYKSRRVKGGDVVLFDAEDAAMSLSLPAGDGGMSTADYYFTPVGVTDSTVTMRLEDGARSLDIAYTLRPDAYMLDMRVTARGMAEQCGPRGRAMGVTWTDHLKLQEKGYDFENRYSSLTYKKRGGGVDNLKETGDETEEPEEPLGWVAFKNQFFSAVLLARQDFTKARLETEQENDKKSLYLKTYRADLETPLDPTGARPTEMQMYLGPNDFHTLQAHDAMALSDEDPQLEELVYLGWWLFRWINRWSILYLFDWLSALGLPMGVVLLLLTVIVKVLVYPTTRKSYVSGAKMRVLKPRVDAIAAKYPKQEDAMRKQQETMQLYSQYGVSPMGGCLPMLIQMPVWLALFNFVPNAIALRGERFLWADDLSAYDDVIRWNGDVWLLGDHLSLFCVLFCATNVINTWISMRQQQSQMSGEQASQMKMMQYMMYIMPLMFFFMFNGYSSGLCYYYFLSGLTSILIMWYLRRATDEDKLLKRLEAYRAQHKDDPKRASGMAARLEALQKMQAEQRARGGAGRK